MKKVKYNAKIARKVALYCIIVLIVGLLGYSIISSYTNLRHTTTKSVGYDDTIPTSNYQEYVKTRPSIGIDSKDVNRYTLNEEPYISRLNSSKNTGLTGKVSGTVVGSYELWPNTLTDIDKYSQYLDGKKGYYTAEEHNITFSVELPKTGFYYGIIEYFIPKGKGSNVQRQILVNDKPLFAELDTLTFNRTYRDSAETIAQDINGNDIKPSQKEVYVKRSTYLQDETGYIQSPYMIYFQKGMNTVTFVGVRDDLVIIDFSIVSISYYKMPTYEEYYEMMSQKTNTTKDTVTNVLDKYEVEDSSIRTSSSPTLYPISDRASATNYPSHPVKTKYNAVGGSKWSKAGDTINWKISVETDGFYKIAFRAKQDLNRGLFTTRRLLIDDVQLFQEATNCRFYYDSNYSMVTCGDEFDNPYYIYLSKGEHTIGLQASLGDYGQAISDVQKVIDDLNDLYLRIIAITTANPDDYSDYKLYGDNARLQPNEFGQGMQEIFQESAVTLNNVSKLITKLTGEKSSLNNVLDKLVLQIGGFVDANGDGISEDVGGFASKPRNVTKDLNAFKTNLSSLGTWVLDIKSQTLTIESLYVYTDDQILPRAEDTFFQSLWFGLSGFVQSFWFDYESIGVMTEEGFDREIEVWFLTSGDSGREQANVVKSLIDQYFIYDKENYKDYECNVILKILAPSVLLPATLAGTGPDVAINVDGGLPVNYALRDAIYNIGQFEDFEEVVSERYTKEEMVPFAFDDGVSVGYYGMPNTVSYLVMFYRTDIFEENGWVVPTTWDEVISLVIELQVSNLSFYLPLEGAGSQIYATILYQMGGKFYTDDYKACDFSTEVSKKAFEEWCGYFSDYSFDKAANFSNRFRSGEMPIGISSFTLYNTLSVFAPDIAGKWDFAPIPGHVRSDGTIDNRGALSSTASVIMKNTEDAEASWAFLKFWTSTDIQVQFANEIESILGSGARHNTANINAMKLLAWSNKELNILIPAFEKGFGVPEVAGGYYIGRNLENAIREVINNKSNPRETLAEYVEMINSEITRKRQEFGLPVD